MTDKELAEARSKRWKPNPAPPPQRAYAAASSAGSQERGRPRSRSRQPRRESHGREPSASSHPKPPAQQPPKKVKVEPPRKVDQPQSKAMPGKSFQPTQEPPTWLDSTTTPEDIAQLQIRSKHKTVHVLSLGIEKFEDSRVGPAVCQQRIASQYNGRPSRF